MMAGAAGRPGASRRLHCGGWRWRGRLFGRAAGAGAMQRAAPQQRGLLQGRAAARPSPPAGSAAQGLGCGVAGIAAAVARPLRGDLAGPRPGGVLAPPRGPVHHVALVPACLAHAGAAGAVLAAGVVAAAAHAVDGGEAVAGGAARAAGGHKHACLAVGPAVQAGLGGGQDCPRAAARMSGDEGGGRSAGACPAL